MLSAHKRSAPERSGNSSTARELFDVQYQVLAVQLLVNIDRSVFIGIPGLLGLELARVGLTLVRRGPTLQARAACSPAPAR
jgi:hypothetical protein